MGQCRPALPEPEEGLMTPAHPPGPPTVAALAVLIAASCLMAALALIAWRLLA